VGIIHSCLFICCFQVDSDEYSLSEAEPLPTNLGRLDEDDQSNVNGSDYHCLSDESDRDSNDEDTDMTDVEEMDEIYEPSDSAPELNSNEPVLDNYPTQGNYWSCDFNSKNFSDFDDSLYSSDLPENCISLNIRTERRIQIFVIASVLCTLLVGALFGDLYTLRNFHCQPQTPDEVRFYELTF
jgi:hypothetical protein